MDNIESITGLSKIINIEKTKKNIDVQKIEKDLLEMKKIEQSDINTEMKNILNTCNINSTNNTNSTTNSNNNYNTLKTIIKHNNTEKIYEKSNNESDEEIEENVEESEENVEESNNECDEESDEETTKQEFISLTNNNIDASCTIEDPIKLKKFKGEEFMDTYEKTGSPDFVSEYYGDVQVGNYKKNYQSKIYNETYNLENFNNLNNNDEEKELLILDIEEMLDELNLDEITLSRIPEITDNMPIEIIQRIHKRVKRKYDRHKCEDLGKNILITLVRGLERICNGKNRIFGMYPDLTGWHRTVRTKLSKLNYEQSVIVTRVIEKYKVGPSVRLGLELIPSALIYSINKQDHKIKQQHNMNTTNSRAEVYDDLHTLYG